MLASPMSSVLISRRISSRFLLVSFTHWYNSATLVLVMVILRSTLVLIILMVLCSCEEQHREPIPLAEAVLGRAGYVHSPYTKEEVDVRGVRPGLAMLDVSDELARKFIVPWVEPEAGGDIPYAIPVPGRPGYVYSPYTDSPVNVRDVPAGTIITDPNDGNRSQRFRIAPTS